MRHILPIGYYIEWASDYASTLLRKYHEYNPEIREDIHLLFIEELVKRNARKIYEAADLQERKAIVKLNLRDAIYKWNRKNDRIIPTVEWNSETDDRLDESALQEFNLIELRQALAPYFPHLANEDLLDSSRLGRLRRLENSQLLKDTFGIEND